MPQFADPKARYPLIVYAHGANAHGIYDVAHAHYLASHGYIVAVINYGDDRTPTVDDAKSYRAFLRPLISKAVIDSLLQSEMFGAHINSDSIGISGHSFGGYTALAMAGGKFMEKPKAVIDERIKAIVLAAPWVGTDYEEKDFFVFGANNRGLNKVTTPALTLFGTDDKVTLSSQILPATKQFAGPSYVIELVGQPHVFEAGSWEDRNAWELLFFNAYLKNDTEALQTLQTARSMKGGNEDYQLADYQKTQISSSE
jgi:predicted dienelactone hydrolase